MFECLAANQVKLGIKWVVVQLPIQDPTSQPQTHWIKKKNLRVAWESGTSRDMEVSSLCPWLTWSECFVKEDLIGLLDSSGYLLILVVVSYYEPKFTKILSLPSVFS